MSKIKEITIPKDIVKKLLYISKKFSKLNTGNKSRNFWMVSEENSESYQWDSFDIGVNDKGELIAVSQSGCSCNSYEFPQEADNAYKLEGEMKVPYNSYYTTEFTELQSLFDLTNTLYDLFRTKKFTADGVLKIRNAEIRRAVIEYIGLDTFLKKANPTVVDESKWGKLVKIKSPKDEWGKNTDEDIVAVYVKDASTPRRYFLRVPPKTKTAKEAVAWTFGFSEEEYNPEVET